MWYFSKNVTIWSVLLNLVTYIEGLYILCTLGDISLDGESHEEQDGANYFQIKATMAKLQSNF